ncbi:hypothetical protein CWE09_09630 [Aliidiomarina minuta]|uniref:Serine hydrolase n=1 Tax=Aliidiomarina minuta TaxID=880057 RepID=A0A432W9V4_9GAMM|nr:serine hydrolase [Aliidiomarina minuta]RUO26930.1 hypothetical protein CWE09_09630 [Aliidiomarina minuta]
MRTSALLASLCTASLLSSQVTIANEGPGQRLSDIDDYIEQGRQQWQIPGMAVGIVHQDRLIHAQGYGSLGLEHDTPVDQDTLFGVASTSKAMTATALGMLVDDGKLDWDDKVIEHLPYFKLSDPWVTQEVRIRDLLTHRVGVGRMTGNRIRFMPTSDRETVIRQMRYHEFEQPFRSSYVYSNVMYSVAGEIVAEVSGMSWDDFVAQRIFTPLDMTRSNTSITQFSEDDQNIAFPHQFIEGQIQPINRRNFDNVGPSASVNTSVRDMAQWIRLQLGEAGVYNGQRLVSEDVMLETHQPQNALKRSHNEASPAAYGFGWSLNSYQGYATASHGGATDGFNTSLMLVPELDLGIIVITNTFENYRPAVVNEIIDRVADLPRQDWKETQWDAYQERFAEVMEQREAIEAERQSDTHPSLNKEQMTGRYEDDLYGEVEVFATEDGNLALHFWDDGESILDLEHWHHDTWRASYRNRAQREKFVHFTRDRDGEAGALHVTWTLRPALLQVGIYPTPYSRETRFQRKTD